MPISFEKFLKENETNKNDLQGEFNTIKNNSTVTDQNVKKSRKNLVSFINNSFNSIKKWEKPVLPVDELLNNRQKCKKRENQPQVTTELKPSNKKEKLKKFLKKAISKTFSKTTTVSVNSGFSKHSTTNNKGSDNSLRTNKSYFEIEDQNASVELYPLSSTNIVEKDLDSKEVTNSVKVKDKLYSRYIHKNKSVKVRKSISSLSGSHKHRRPSSISFDTGKPDEDLLLERTIESQKRKKHYAEYKLEELSKVTAVMFARTQIEVLYNANTNGLQPFNQFLEDLRNVNS